LTCLQAVQTLRIFEHEFVKYFFEMTEVPDMELRTALMVALKFISKNVTAGAFEADPQFSGANCLLLYR
jgi:hypothetical protein